MRVILNCHDLDMSAAGQDDKEDCAEVVMPAVQGCSHAPYQGELFISCRV